MRSPERTSLTDDALIGRLGEARLFWRVTPQQKLRVIMALKRMRQTVGFLGDRINDAPALHAADAGISVDSLASVTEQQLEQHDPVPGRADRLAAEVAHIGVERPHPR